jgi:hypothetical protein
LKYLPREYNKKSGDKTCKSKRMSGKDLTEEGFNTNND